MFLHTDRKLLLSHLRPLSVLVLHVLLTHLCTGLPQLIGSSQPIVATLGEDIILPCVLKPATDASDLTLEWTRPDLNPRFVLVWRSGQELEDKKHESFVGRTSLFINELNVGNISLKLSRVKLSDEGTYRCFIPGLRTESFVPLVVGSNVVSSPVVTLAGIDRNRGGLVLQCESEGWYPEPEVSWLDGEGHVLSAGPTETVRGPDGLYTVSSRVTVEERHSNNFTCRVQQKDINQIRETQIHVPDDFFEVLSSSSPIIISLAIILSVCILIILLFVFLFWRQNRIKTKRGLFDLTDKGEKKNGSQSPKTEGQFVSEEERERQPLRTDGTGQMEDEDKKGQKKNKFVKIKQAELQQLHEEKQRNEEELKNLREQLENKNKELKTSQPTSSFYGLVSPVEKNQQSADRKCCEANEELKRTREELEDKRAKLDQTTRHVDELRAAELKLKEEEKKSEIELQQLRKELETKNQQFQDQKQREEKLQELMRKNTELEEKLQEETKKREEAEGEVKKLKKNPEAVCVNKSDQDSNISPDQTPHSSDPQTIMFTEDESKHEASVNLQRNKTNSSSQSLTTGLDVKVGQEGKRFHLRNTSREDKQIGGWKLEVQINNREPIKHTLKNPLKLSPGGTYSISVPGYNSRSSPTDMVLVDLKGWKVGDKLQVVLISDTGETHHLSVHRQ